MYAEGQSAAAPDTGTRAEENPALDEVLTMLRAAIDRLQDTDPLSGSELGGDGAGLGEALVELQRQQNRLSAVAARLSASFAASGAWADDGSRSPAAWLAHRCRIPKADAWAQLRLGRDLRRMPHTDMALSSGEIAVHHARRLAPLARNHRTAAAFGGDEKTLVGHARNMSWPHFAKAVAYWRQVVDPDGPDDDATDDDDRRRVHLSSGMYGTGILDGLLTPLAYATVNEALERIYRELLSADKAEARQRVGDDYTLDDLRRTPAQRRHDALVEMANRAMTAPKDGKRPLPLLSIFVGYETFAGRICETADGLVITPRQALSVIDEALIERVVFDGPSRVTDIGGARLFTGALRRAIELRDRQCQWPGCDVAGRHCHVDHIIPHSEGGATAQDNGQLYCNYHNLLKERLRTQHKRPQASRRSRQPDGGGKDP